MQYFSVQCYIEYCLELVMQYVPIQYFKKNYTTYIKPSILYTIDRLCNAQYVDELHIIIKQYILYTLQKTIIYF